jgi:hypothetical protein
MLAVNTATIHADPTAYTIVFHQGICARFARPDGSMEDGDPIAQRNRFMDRSAFKMGFYGAAPCGA